MSDLPKTASELLTLHKSELVKVYVELDLNSRPFRLYTANTKAKTGDPCIVTEYIYAGLTSTQIKGRKEGYTTWDESWIPDSAFSSVPQYNP